MAIALVATVATAQADDNPLTSAIDTTGANLLVAVVVDHTSGPGGAVDDNKGNNGWVGLTVPTLANSSRTRIYYHTNSPVVGSGHQFQFLGSGIYSTIIFAAFSGAHATAPFDQESGASSASAATVQPGSLTPSVNDCLIITGVGVDVEDNGISINESFVTPVGLEKLGTIRGGYLSYKIQTTAGAQNPTWTSVDNNAMTAVMAVFKPAAAGGGDALVGVVASGQVGNVSPSGGIQSLSVVFPGWYSVRR